YDAVGNLAGFLYPNGVQTSYTYNTLNRLTNVTGARTATLASYTYTLGPSGNRTAVTEANGRQVDYTYDDLYRLKSETISADPSGPNGAISYTYDKVGNRLTRSSTVAVIPDQSFAYDFNDRLDGEGYDDNGNTLTSGSRTFGYDFENHLVTADGGVSFVYNGDGIRVAKSAGGVTTGFLVDDRNPTGYAQVLEEIVGGSVEKSYTYGLKLISQKQASGVSFYGFDGHGSVRYLTDASGGVTDTYFYEAFGNLVGQVGATANDYLYAGEQREHNLAAYFLRARWIFPSTGRFGTNDPLLSYARPPRFLHAYGYANADPVNGHDPTGLYTLTELTATNAIIGSLATLGWTYSAYGYGKIFQNGRQPDASVLGISFSWAWSPTQRLPPILTPSGYALIPRVVPGMDALGYEFVRAFSSYTPTVTSLLGIGFTGGIEIVSHVQSRKTYAFMYAGITGGIGGGISGGAATIYSGVRWRLPDIRQYRGPSWSFQAGLFSAPGPVVSFGNDFYAIGLIYQTSPGWFVAPTYGFYQDLGPLPYSVDTMFHFAPPPYYSILRNL
ncbi:MAG TPA: RHS repeat-associated core domain-containing protein, partial [Aggregatilineales bacterium]|nr:RHS repeat-associated core domain-containing protein [Aggregatilineales bacterium]